MSTRRTGSRVPRTDVVLADPRLADARGRLGDALVKQAVHRAQGTVWASGSSLDDFVDGVLTSLPARAASLTPVLNATGVLLHTNLGRAPLSAAAGEALLAATGYTDVEYDLATGQRTSRGGAAREALLRAVRPAEDALVVNNGAAALVLAAVTLAPGKDIVISRGELIEIGGSFRIADILTSAGARLREVGSTNRTRLADYQAAVGPDTGFVLKVHPSNFTMRGFTSDVAVRELASLGVPVVADVGSGLLTPDRILPREPDASTWLTEGADLVTASADKLLGGPQAGIILGRSEWVRRLRRHPMARALRVGKLTLAALEATITGPPPPLVEMLHGAPDALEDRTRALCQRVAERGIGARVVPSTGVIGGGSAPEVNLPGWAIELPADFAGALRTGRPSVIARVESGRCLVDIRCVPAARDDDLRDAVIAAADRLGAHTADDGGRP